MKVNETLVGSLGVPIPLYPNKGIGVGNLHEYWERIKRGESVMYYDLEMSQESFEERLISFLGDKIEDGSNSLPLKYGCSLKELANRYGLGKGLVGGIASAYVMGDLHINSFKRNLFPENKKHYLFTLRKFI